MVQCLGGCRGRPGGSCYRRTGEAVRRGPGAGRGGSRAAGRRGARAARPERRREDHRGADPGHAPRTGQRPGLRRRAGAAVDPYLTGRENLRLIGRLSGLSRAAARRRADELLERLDLTAGAARQARTYSGGTRRRLDVAASLVGRPPVLFLDEPTTGLDPRGRLALWQLLGELTAEGTALLLTTQYTEEADRLADTVVVIDHGRVITTGTPGQLKTRAGADRLELQAPPGADPRRLAAAVAPLASAPPAVDAAGQIVLQVSDGPAVLADLAARLAAAGLSIAGLTLRRPTLDDAFLALTGQPAPERSPGAAVTAPAAHATIAD